MQHTMESREHAESAAAAWIARREREDWNAAAQAELDAWIEAASGNRVAWLRVDAAWQQTSRLKSLSTSARAGTVPARDEIRLPFFESHASENAHPPTAGGPPSTEIRRELPRALAASVLLTIAAAAAWYFLPGGSSYQTDIGALQAVPLSDGSRVTLNTNTEIRVDVTSTERRVNLKQGEVYFEVAKDPSRPFIVNAGNKRIIAVGTEFSVRREKDDVQVFVTEGKVRVEEGADAVAHPIAQLKAGSIARAGTGGLHVQEKPIAEVEQLLTWRTGHLVFDKTPLADAVAEFNRYNTRRIVIVDPSVASIRVGGNFRATNVDAFVRLIASDFPVSATQQGSEIILSGIPPAGK